MATTILKEQKRRFAVPNGSLTGIGEFLADKFNKKHYSCGVVLPPEHNYQFSPKIDMFTPHFLSNYNELLPGY